MRFSASPPPLAIKKDITPGPDGLEYWVRVNDKRKTVEIFIYGFWGGNDLWSVLSVTTKPLLWNQRARAHSGFVRQAETLISHEADLIHFYVEEGYKFLYTGHSMGAAVAILLADRHDKLYDEVPTCEVFACPRCIGNQGFIDSFQVPVTAHYVGADIIRATALVFWLGCVFSEIKNHESKSNKPWFKRLFSDHLMGYYSNIEFTNWRW